jgi:hypothetical protein
MRISNQTLECKRWVGQRFIRSEFFYPSLGVAPPSGADSTGFRTWIPSGSACL